MEPKYKPILPHPGASSQAASSTRIYVEETESKKRRRSVHHIACNRCRTKKISCNGLKPICTQCERADEQCLYRSTRSSRHVEDEETPKRLRDNKQHQQIQSEVIQLLRSLPLHKATEMLQHLRNNLDLPTAISTVQSTNSLTTAPSGLRVARAVAPPTGSATEFELTAQFSTAYPRIPPPDIQALRGLLGQNNDTQATPTLGRIRDLSPSILQGRSQSTTRVASGEYCDSRLKRLKISYWSKVPVSDEVAAGLISFFIETDHKTLGFFDADLFLEDLVQCRSRFCSSFLVSAVLCLASQTCAATKPQSNEIRLAAFKEAEMFWQGERSDESLISLAAIGVFSAACIYEGKDILGQELVSALRGKAERLGLCGEPADVSKTGNLRLDSPAWMRATSQTAWGVHSWLTLHVIFYHRKPIPCPPALPIPGEDRSLDIFQSSLTYLGPTFPSMCRLWTTAQEVLAVYASASSTRISDRVPLGFAEGKYQKLLVWVCTLGSDMKRKDNCTYDVMIFHIVFHVVVAMVFRPFIDAPRSTRLMSLTSIDSHPKAIYAASVSQLKDLVFCYHQNYPEAAFTAFFNPGLVTLSIALLEDLRDPLWQYYLYLCARCWQDLYICYPVFRDVAKAFLSMAMQKDAITGQEAQKLLRGIESSGEHHTTAVEASASFLYDPVSDKAHEVQVHTMADRFEEMVVFDELINKDSTSAQ